MEPLWNIVYALTILLLVYIIICYDNGLIRLLSGLGIGLTAFVWYSQYIVAKKYTAGYDDFYGGAAAKAATKKAAPKKAAKDDKKAESKKAESKKADASVEAPSKDDKAAKEEDKPKSDRPPRDPNHVKKFKAKWLNAPMDDVRKNLDKQNAKLVHSSKKHVFKTYTSDAKNEDGSKKRGYGILGQEYTAEGDCDMTLIAYGDFQFPVEIEKSACDKFDETSTIIKKTKGIREKMVMEMFREKYVLKKDNPLASRCKEITIDHYPGFEPYVEITCFDEEALVELAKALGLDPEKRSYGGFIRMYNQEYGIDEEALKNGITELTFAKAADLKKYVKTNAAKFKELTKRDAVIGGADGGHCPSCSMKMYSVKDFDYF